MGFRGLKILGFPTHLQSRLDKSPAHVAEDLFGERLTKKRRCTEGTHDRALSASMSQPASAALKPKQARIPTMWSGRDKDQSGSSDSSAPPMPILISASSEDEDERAPPIPTPPVFEYLRWEGPPPVAPTTTSVGNMKGQSMHLIQRTPSRRGSLAEATTAHAITDHATNRFPPPVTNVPTTTAMTNANQANQSSITLNADTVRASTNAPMRRNDTNGLETPLVGSQRPLTHIAAPSAPIVGARNVALYPVFTPRIFRAATPCSHRGSR